VEDARARRVEHLQSGPPGTKQKVRVVMIDKVFRVHHADPVEDCPAAQQATCGCVSDALRRIELAAINLPLANMRTEIALDRVEQSASRFRAHLLDWVRTRRLKATLSCNLRLTCCAKQSIELHGARFGSALGTPAFRPMHSAIKPLWQTCSLGIPTPGSCLTTRWQDTSHRLVSGRPRSPWLRTNPERPACPRPSPSAAYRPASMC